MSNTDQTALERRKARQEMLTGSPERRNFAADMELRTTSDGNLRFTGYASTTETPYEVNRTTEKIARGAFRRTLGEQPDVVLLIEHGGLPLARTTSGTLTLTEDARGLKVDADLDPSDPDVQALVPKLERKDLTEMSFAFRATDDDWSDDRTQRTIRALSIHRGDVSIVSRGANAATAAELTMRSAQAHRDCRKSHRDYLDIVKAKRARLRHVEARRTFSQAERDKYAKEGIALEDGSFPIPDVSSLKDAISAYGRAGNKATAKAHIKKRARALGRADLIPDSWRAVSGMNRCAMCAGTGHIPGQGRCPACAGTGRRPRARGPVGGGKVLPGGPEGVGASTGGATAV